MSVKMKILIVLLVLFHLNSLGQHTALNLENLNQTSNRLDGKLYGRIYHSTAHANQYFLTPIDWVDGEIQLSDGDVVENMKMRYDAKNDELVAYNDNLKSLLYVEKEQVKGFIMQEDGVSRKFVKIKNRNINWGSQYFEELYGGQNSLLARHYVHEQKVSPFKDKYGIMRDSEYLMKVEYYFYSVDEGYEKVGVKKRAYLAAYPEKKREIKKILRSENIRISDEKSMIRAFKVLDERGIF